MKTLDLLRKLGILRGGVSKGKYTNATERPLSLQDDCVYNEEKDLTTKKDVQKIIKKFKGKK